MVALRLKSTQLPTLKNGKIYFNDVEEVKNALKERLKIKV